MNNEEEAITLTDLMRRNDAKFDRYSQLNAAAAAKHMLQSERGEQCLREFYAMLDNGGHSLDAPNFGCLVALCTAMRSEDDAFSTLRDILSD